MPDCIKLNEGNIDVCEREVIALARLSPPPWVACIRCASSASEATRLRRISRMRWMFTE